MYRPLEMVFGLLRPGMPQLQYKVNKATDAIVGGDRVLVCAAWGFSVAISCFHDLDDED